MPVILEVTGYRLLATDHRTMLDSFTSETFAPYEGETFLLQLEGLPSVELQLISVTTPDVATSKRMLDRIAELGLRMPFSLLFRSRPGLYLPQSTYHLEHEKLGGMDLFLVPLGPDREGMTFEAAFG